MPQEDRGVWQSLFGWPVTGVVVSIIIGFGWVLVSIPSPQFNLAQWAFTVAAFLLSAKVAHFVIAEEGSKQNGLHAGTFSFLVFGTIACIWILSLRWVDGLRPPKISSGVIADSTPRIPVPASAVSPATPAPAPAIVPIAPPTAKEAHKPALSFRAFSVGVRNMPERARVTNTWNDKPWDEDNYADVRLTITSALDLPLQNLDLNIYVAEDDPKAGIAGIAQLTNISGVEFRKPPFQVPEPALRLRGEDGKTYNLPMPGVEFFNEHRIVPDYGMFCPRLGQKDIIRLILATIYVGGHNRPPERLKITGTYVIESGEGRTVGQINEVITVTQ